MWQTGTANDYLELLDDLVKIATGTHVSAVVINSGGTGYAVGDILSVNGGTSDPAGATLRVTSVTGGSDVIDGIVVQTGGAYTSNPSTSANAVTGGSGSGATMDLTMTSTGWTKQRRTQEAVSATLGVGGSGYTNGSQVLTVDGGVGVAETAQFNVTVSGGAVTSVDSLAQDGSYEEVPANAVSVTGGGGSGATLNVTWQDKVDEDHVVILEGTGAGSDEIVIGIKTFNTLGQDSFTQAYNWQLHGMTGYQSGNAFHLQTEISPGLDGSGAVEGTGAPIVPLKENDSYPLEYGFAISSSRITGFVKVESASVVNYATFYMGFLNRFATATEMPYPMYIAGTCARDDTLFDSTVSLSGLLECGGNSSHTNPAYLYKSANTWKGTQNVTIGDTGSPTKTVSSSGYHVWPLRSVATAFTGNDDDLIAQTPISSVLSVTEFIPTTGIPGTFTYKIGLTPETGDDLYFLLPSVVYEAVDNDNQQLWGSMDGVFWFMNIDGTLSSEDTFTINDQQYVVIQNGSRTEEHLFMAIRQD